MWLLLLIPFTLFWPVVALVAEGTPLHRYRGTPGKELLALLFCTVAYMGVWLLLFQLGSAMTGSAAAGIVAASILALLAVIPLLFIGYKIFGVKPSEEAAAH